MFTPAGPDWAGPHLVVRLGVRGREPGQEDTEDGQAQNYTEEADDQSQSGDSTTPVCLNLRAQFPARLSAHVDVGHLGLVRESGQVRSGQVRSD